MTQTVVEFALVPETKINGTTIPTQQYFKGTIENVSGIFYKSDIGIICLTTHNCWDDLNKVTVLDYKEIVRIHFICEVA
jgi:hypothetical protein